MRRVEIAEVRGATRASTSVAIAMSLAAGLASKQSAMAVERKAHPPPPVPTTVAEVATSEGGYQLQGGKINPKARAQIDADVAATIAGKKRGLASNSATRAPSDARAEGVGERAEGEGRR